ncbi:large-conductance mechanosensitive channel protein MscL [Petrotoga sp. 9PWA.NaAc.5.4]|uniref:large-conductance mechanosensitive channel protein MscL n=1 Tax=Petrotoga sp. 9PWA.NaAc.5.4 TaxID=1434328 RepID=UPI000CCB65CA|nr:large-conductance mechanosensitive channel protein MscL [Petrotoga sp. 9PWA.NaAc.5.4]PNR97161.1 large conductance mechanosensitive channel protein MscL [Petrotoga sp. 9PWA.NaAc.5.4]
MWSEFKKFAVKGNVIDLAVGVIIGSAFSKIVTSLVNDILMPFIGLLIGGINFASLEFRIGEATIKYGNFIQTVVDFLIVAFSIFIFVRFINKIRKEFEKPTPLPPPPTPPAPSKEEVLLTDIKNILQEIKSKK